MATIVSKQTITITDPQGDITTREWTKTVSSLTQIVERHLTLTSGSTAILWDPTTTDPITLADFDFMLLTADQDTEVEMTANDGDSDEELSHFTVCANVPLVLAADDANYNYSTDAFAGVADVIDRIRVKNPSGPTANIYFLLST